MAIITVAEAKQYLPGLNASSSAEDTVIGVLVDAASTWIARYCGYPGKTPTVEDISYTRYLTPDDPEDLLLDVLPVVSITTIHDDPDRGYGAAHLVDSANYALLDGDAGLVVTTETGTHSWSVGSKRAVKAVFTAGYATIPDDMKLACRMIVRASYDLRKRSGVVSETAAGGTQATFRDEDVPQGVRRLLKPFMLPLVFRVGA